MKPQVPHVAVRVGDHRFRAKLEVENAPRTVEAFLRLLPFKSRLVHARWSGEACWIPLGDLDLGVPLERGIHEPTPGMVLFHPADASESEILVPYGKTKFASSHGALRGTHFLTIMGARRELARLGQDILMRGARRIEFRRLE